MADNKRKKTSAKVTVPKKTTRAKNELKADYYEFKLLGLLAFTILSAFSLHSGSAGALGAFLRALYFGLFAKAGYVIPYGILIVGFLCLNRNMASVRLRYSVATVLAACIVLFSVTLLDSRHIPADFLSLSGLQQAHKAGIAGYGGGVFGAILVGAMLKTVGMYGAWLVTACMVLALLMLTTPFTLTGAGLFVRGTAAKTAVKTGEVLAEANRNIQDAVESVRTEAPEKDRLKKQHSIMKLMRNEKFEEGSVTLPDDEGTPIVITPEEVPEGEPAQMVIRDIPIIESAPSVPAKKQEPKPVKEFKKVESAGDLNLEVADINAQAYPEYVLPSMDLLNPAPEDTSQQDRKEILANASLLEETLGNFGIEVKVVQISRGPAITRYELQPSPGVKVSRIVSLSDDIALSLAAQQVRIVAPIPGKAAVGIEVPNKTVSMVAVRDVLESESVQNSDSSLSVALGKDISGKSIVADLGKMPHLLVAGSTGSGKSVCINSIISSLLFRTRPDEVKFLMIDPKVVELNIYNGIPHLILPVVTDPKKAAAALNWAVQEMTDRYKSFAESGVRDIAGYNRKLEESGQGGAMPKIVVIIDELADLMMVAPNAVEDAICRLAQMARAAGIHLIVATQRPSVDVITGVIKANIPSRIAFAVSSQIDSRTIIDMAGAEKLLGKGDMLYYPVGMSKPMRVQGCFISDSEVERTVDFIKGQSGDVTYNPEILDSIKVPDVGVADNSDEFLDQAIEFVVASKQASASLLQRKFRVGYNRAARMIDSMEERGIVGPAMGAKPREVLLNASELEDLYEDEE